MASFEIMGIDESISLEDRAEYTLGREDTITHTFPDIDLTPYGAAEAGISRRHAKVTRLGEGRYYIMDLSSTNYTHVNGERLEPFEPKVMADGDEVFLGSMKLIFHA